MIGNVHGGLSELACGVANDCRARPQKLARVMAVHQAMAIMALLPTAVRGIRPTARCVTRTLHRADRPSSFDPAVAGEPGGRDETPWPQAAL
jgi:hypothetical protein